jgi:membrane protein YdbS with pleckstrin-like domain
MAEPNNRDSGEDPEPSPADEPYPWRNSEPESEDDQEPSPEPGRHPDETTRSSEPRDGEGPPQTQPRREQETESQERPREQARPKQSRRPAAPGDARREQSEPPGVKPVDEDIKTEDDTDVRESSNSLKGKVILFLIGGLSKIWHAKVLGFYWLLPRVTGSTDPQKGLSGRFYPTSMIRQDEKVIYKGNPSRWLSPGPYVFSGILLFIALVITIAVPLGYGKPMLDAVTPAVLDLSVPSNWWYAPVLLTAVAFLLLFYVVMLRASTWHVVTDKRLLHRENVLAPNRTRLDLIDIKSIDCRQPLPERWYNVGYIDIYTASTGGKELSFEGVKDAPNIANQIDQVRYDYQQRIRGGYPEDAEASEGEHPRRHPDQKRSEPRHQGHRDPGTQQPTGNRSSTHREERHHANGRGNGRSASDHPREKRRDGSATYGGGNGDQFAEPSPNSTVQEGDSIEEQRPDHTLRDDLEDPFRGDES